MLPPVLPAAGEVLREDSKPSRSRWWLIDHADVLRCLDPFPLLRQAAVEPPFRRACLGLFVIALLLAAGLAPVWLATPREFLPRIRIRGLDYLQSLQFEASAKSAWTGGDLDTAYHCWRQAMANHPGRIELLRWGLQQTAGIRDRRDPRLEAAIGPAFWLLRLNRTNAADVDLVVRALSGIRGVRWLSDSINALPSPRTPVQQAVLLCERLRQQGFPSDEPDWPPATGFVELDQCIQWARSAWALRQTSRAEFPARRAAAELAYQSAGVQDFVDALEFWAAHSRRDLWGMETELEYLGRRRRDLPLMHVAYWERLRERGRTGEARAAAMGFVQPRMHPEELIQVAGALLQLGLDTEALACLRAHVSRSGNSLDLWLFYTGELRRRARWEELRLVALQLRENVSRIPALRSYGYFLEGVCWHREGQRLRALKAFDCAVRGDTSPPSLSQAMAMQLLDLGYAGHGMEWLTHLEPELGRDPEYWLHRQQAALACRDWTAVLNASRRRLTLVPQDSVAVRHLVSALLLRNPLDPELPVLSRRSLALEPGHRVTQLNQVRVLLARGRVNEATARFALIAESHGDEELEAFHKAVAFELACARGEDVAALSQWSGLDQGALPGAYLDRLRPLHRERVLRMEP